MLALHANPAPRPRTTARLLLLALAALLASSLASAEPVLMISLDGLRPDYVTHADEHGLRIPTLRRFLTQGSYAEGVVGVVPTVTYPSHTTLITGVWPAEHGILNNTTVDPLRTADGAWYWYASDIKVPTLWSAARAAGIRSASVSWPVSVDAPVDYLIPEYWRSSSPSGGENPDDRKLMAALTRPVGWLAAQEPKLGPYMAGNVTTVESDAVRTKYSLEILRTVKPGFMTIHLSSLDESEHEAGPFSDEADKTLEALDGMVGELIAAARANDPKTVVVIVSDHGFAPISHSLNIAIPFIEAGLVTLGNGAGSQVRVTSWQAEPWATGGMAAIMLHDPSDEAVKQKVKALLDKLAADPANGVAQILDGDEVKKRGGFPGASFLLALKPGWVTGGAFTGPLVTPLEHRGTHGYLPDFPEMRSSFFIEGAGIAPGRNLGIVDMRQIAPTVAGILKTNLPTAKQPTLNVSR